MRLKWLVLLAVLLALVAFGAASVFHRQQDGPKVTLRWKPSPTPGVEGYFVYRSGSRDGPFANISGKEPVHGLEFVDRLVLSGRHYYYRVTAVRGKDESWFSPRWDTVVP
jgi:hypothetical protein